MAKANPEVFPDRHLGSSVVAALVAATMVYLTLPAIGYLILGQYALAVGCLLGAAVCAGVLKWLMGRIELAADTPPASPVIDSSSDADSA